MYTTRSNLIISNKEKDKGNLYLGGFSSIDELDSYQIRAVISIMDYQPDNLGKDVFHMKIYCEDDEGFPIIKYFEECIQFIQKYTKQTNILVHCAAGVSRSATIVIAYVIKIHQMNLKQAYDFVKLQRPFIEPNRGFKSQLEEYYQQIQKKQ